MKYRIQSLIVGILFMIMGVMFMIVEVSDISAYQVFQRQDEKLSELNFKQASTLDDHLTKLMDEVITLANHAKQTKQVADMSAFNESYKQVSQYTEHILKPSINLLTRTNIKKAKRLMTDVHETLQKELSSIITLHQKRLESTIQLETIISQLLEQLELYEAVLQNQKVMEVETYFLELDAIFLQLQQHYEAYATDVLTYYEAKQNYYDSLVTFNLEDYFN